MSDAGILMRVRADQLCLSDMIREGSSEHAILAASVSEGVVTLALAAGAHVLQRIYARAAVLDVVRQ